jgi:hypothetical protein
MRRTALGWGLVVLGLGVASVSVLGPLMSGVIRYHVAGDVLNQITGGDLVALVLVAPVAIVAGILTLRGVPMGPVLALAPAGFAVYTEAQLVVGGDFAVQPGNSGRFFLLFLGVFVLAGLVLVGSWRAVEVLDLPVTSGRAMRLLAALLWVVAGFLVIGLHLPGLVDVIDGAPYGVEYTQSPGVFWVVKLMDLGMVVPLIVATGVGLWHGMAWSRKLAYGVVGWAALLGSSVAGMAVVMQVNRDPAASTANTVVFGVFALAFLVWAASLYRPLVRHPRPVSEPVAR